MAKTKKKKTKNKELPQYIRHLQKLLTYTEKSINGVSEQLDSLFTNQAKRLREEIQKAEKNQ